jgi:hypothetical protein
MARWVDDLRASAASAQARTALIEAGASLTEFGNVDHRAREYVKSGQTLMAADVVFADGSETAAAAARHVEAARLAEHQAFDAVEAGLRRQQAIAIGSAVAVGGLATLLLAFAAPGRSRDETAAAGSDAEAVPDEAARPTGELMLRDISGPTSRSGTQAHLPPDQPAVSPGSQLRGSVPMLKAAAELCTEFGRVNDPGDLPGLLARAAEVMDASGLIVWLGNSAGADLRPVIAHGYPEHVLARMPNVPRSADNAAAQAYRSGKLQIVLRLPGGNGAVVAPLLSPDGCVGALTAEIMSGSETTDSVQALATLIAAQLTGVLAGSAPAAETRIVVSR